MKNIVIFMGGIMVALAGCYEDKGNYDYSEINKLDKISFIPEPTETSESSFNYKYRQPALDTLEVTYSPVVSQTQGQGSDNLEFQWIMSKNEEGRIVFDTVFGPELLLKFPPKEKTSYTPLFRAIDKLTGVEYYRDLSMSTVIPFTNSWFVLHGDTGSRKLGVVEDINEQKDVQHVITDVYKEIWGNTRFQDAQGLCYIPHDGRSPAVEHMFVIAPDSLAYMHPFDMVVTKNYELLMPIDVFPRPRLKCGISDGQDAGLFLDESGHLYWSRGWGWLFSAKTSSYVDDYHVDKMFMTESGYAALWDKIHREFMYYYVLQNRLIRSDSEIHPADKGRARLNLFDEGIFEEGELLHQDVLYLGQGNSSISERGTLAVLEDEAGKHTVYQIGFDGWGDSFIEMNRYPAPSLKLEKESQIATSIAFKDQLFYTRGGSLYLYNIISGEETYLYKADGNIDLMKFRSDRWYDKGYGSVDANNRLALVVNRPDGSGEIHEIFLSIGGDVDRVAVYGGFGRIKDIVFSTPGMARY